MTEKTTPPDELGAASCSPLVVSFGGGTNSTAMLCGFRERDIIPSLICFADTGGEMPHTYDHVQEMDAKCREWWGIGIDVVRKTYKGETETLERECLRTGQLPSLAYGYKKCSINFKARPQEQFQKRWAKTNNVTTIRKAIGFGYDEPWRIKRKFDKVQDGKLLILSRYYLVEWQWVRAACIAAINRHGIKQPGKSRCFFCPAVKPNEVLELRRVSAPLFDRAVEIERNSTPAKSGAEGVRGLHFGIKWSDIAAADEAQCKLFDWIGDHASPKTPCGCYDG